MKKLCALLLTIVILLGASTACASDSEFESIPSILTSALDYNASRWYATSANRALFTVLLSGDFLVSSKNIELDLSKPSYVCRAGDVLAVAICITNGDYVIATFVPGGSSDEITYMHTNSSSSTVAELTLDSVGYSYMQNSLTDLLTASEAILEILSN